jgi:hypothetical protein
MCLRSSTDSLVSALSVSPHPSTATSANTVLPSLTQMATLAPEGESQELLGPFYPCLGSCI